MTLSGREGCLAKPQFREYTGGNMPSHRRDAPSGWKSANTGLILVGTTDIPFVSFISLSTWPFENSIPLG
jgi:hypothetical protein